MLYIFITLKLYSIFKTFFFSLQFSYYTNFSDINFLYIFIHKSTYGYIEIINKNPNPQTFLLYFSILINKIIYYQVNIQEIIVI